MRKRKSPLKRRRKMALKMPRYCTLGHLDKAYMRPPSVKLPPMPKSYRMPHIGGDYFYIACKGDKGQMVLLGPYGTEAAAYELGGTRLNTSFKVIPFDTRDRDEATRRFKHMILHETSDLAYALRRMSHQI